MYICVSSITNLLGFTLNFRATILPFSQTPSQILMKARRRWMTSHTNVMWQMDYHVISWFLLPVKRKTDISVSHPNLPLRGLRMDSKYPWTGMGPLQQLPKVWTTRYMEIHIHVHGTLATCMLEVGKTTQTNKLDTCSTQTWQTRHVHVAYNYTVCVHVYVHHNIIIKLYTHIYTITCVDMSISSDKSEASASYYQVMWYVHVYMYTYCCRLV